MEPTRGNYRAQASLEYAMVVAMVLAISIPVWIMIREQTSGASDEVDASLARLAVSQVASAADWAFLQGHPARKVIGVEFPNSLSGFSFMGREARATLATSGGRAMDVYEVSLANLTGDVPQRGGYYNLQVAAVEGAAGLVNVTVVE